MCKNKNRLFVFLLGMVLLLGCSGAANAATPQVVSGTEHSIGLSAEGKVYVWGGGERGQLGKGTTGHHSTTQQVPGLTGAVAVAAGDAHSMALLSDGSVWAWGGNDSGQLGDGTRDGHSSPVQVHGLAGVVAVAAGFAHSIAIKSDGSVWAWGENGSGQLGDGTTTRHLLPVQVLGLTGAVAVAAGYGHSIAIMSDGSVWTWGRNTFGQLGDGTTTMNITPSQVLGLSGVAVAAAAGYGHSIVVMSDGSVWTWGMNDSGQLGDGTEVKRVSPVQISGLTDVVASAAGDAHSVVLKSDGSVWAWGESASGALGDGGATRRPSPVQVPGLTSAVAVAAGGERSTTLNSDGSVLAWGNNDLGGDGDGTFAQRRSPVLVVNANVDGYLNLISNAVIQPPPGLDVPFFVVASGGITASSATVKTTTKFRVDDIGKLGAVFVTAMVPSGTLVPAQSAMRALGMPGSSIHAITSPNPFVLVQLTSSGWQPVMNGQLIAYASGVLGDQLAAQTILNATDPTSLGGAAFCLGYGTSAADMITAKTMRVVATIRGTGTAGAATANCVVASVTTPNAFSFGAQTGVVLSTVATSSAITVSGINVPVAISVTGGEYSIDGGSFTSVAGTVNNGQSVVVRLMSSATNNAVTSATLTIGGVTGSFNVIAKTAAPAVGLSLSGLVFDSQLPGIASTVQSVTLTNSGSATLNLGGITISGDFARSSDCGATLAAGANCRIDVTFTPNAAGMRNGGLSITSDADGSPHSVSLAGVGAANILSFILLAPPGWNLLGNSLKQTLSVASLYGDPSTVDTVWKWDAFNTKWQFYTPSMDAATLQTYATRKGYDVLSAINPGEGYWVKAKAQQPLGTQSGEAFILTAADLVTGWNLVATGNDVTPSAFNTNLKASQPGTGVTTLWAWDNPLAQWYFYAPPLESSGALANYIAGKGYLDFTSASKKLGNGTGFWVNR